MSEPRYRYDSIFNPDSEIDEYCLSDEVGPDGRGPCLVAISTETPFRMADIVKEMNELWDQIVELEAEAEFWEKTHHETNRLFQTFFRAYMHLDEDGNPLPLEEDDE